MPAHPYIPNTEAAIRSRMLRDLQLDDGRDLHAAIPGALRLDRPLDLPEAIRSEAGLRRHVGTILSRNEDCTRALSFLGGGCAHHYVPAVCDAIATRGEFLTAYVGDPHGDLGKYQALFEFQSMLGELTGMEVVGPPTYDGTGAAGSAIAMAGRITGRPSAVLAGPMGAERRMQLANFLKPTVELHETGFDRATGLADPDRLKDLIGGDTAAVYIEMPNFLGAIDTGIHAIAETAHAAGALLVVGVDPLSLSVLAAPAEYGADIVCGDLQPLGLHMNAGGGCAGFIATRDEPAFVAENPAILISGDRGDEGGWRFAWSTMERTSYVKREDTSDYYGTTQWLWGIVAGVYLSLLGPAGLREIGEGLVARAAHGAKRLSALPCVTAPAVSAPHFKEITVDFSATGRSVAEINRALSGRGIFGGHDLGQDDPALAGCALYCFTEMHGQEDIDTLLFTLTEVLS